ncbi:hypothetical protein HMPREF1548_06396, partial [Clostridium sp. KLE 1755]|uniref:hypothetical protein n=1 Tax=Clostridium sp. KLE 1755 TaxID=1226325 RepID=UPI0003962DDC
IHEVAKTSTLYWSLQQRRSRNFNPRGRKDLDKVKRNEKKRAKNFNPRGRKDLDMHSFKAYNAI